MLGYYRNNTRSSSFLFRSLGMPVDDSSNRVNIGHERKRKRIDDKISKSGGKRPRRCDKESRKTYTSTYFRTTQTNNGNHSQANENGNVSTPGNTTTSASSTNDPLNVISKLPISSLPPAGTAPRLVQSIRFLTPINVNIPLQQSNQYVIRRLPE